MRALAELAMGETAIVFGLLLLAVASLALSGRIRLTGIFSNKRTGAFDPARLQLLVVTLLSAGLMLTRLDDMRLAHRVGLPSNAFLYLLCGGHVLYLVQKVRQMRSKVLLMPSAPGDDPSPRAMPSKEE
jgi:hypothetical protein